MENHINDLRSAIELLKRHEGQYLETNHPVDPDAELAGVYRHIGAGGTVKRPTRIGPAMMFNAIKGYPDSRILVGMHASRERAALLLGCKTCRPGGEKPDCSRCRPGGPGAVSGAGVLCRRSGLRSA